MKTIGAAKFREQCLALPDRLDDDGLVVTKYGKPVARVLPHGQQWADMIGSLRDKIEVRGDILSTGVGWIAGVHEADGFVVVDARRPPHCLLD